MAHWGSFAEQPVRVSKLPTFRAEHFPYAGPYPWLDRDDAQAEITERIRSGAFSEREAGLCQYWADNGYVILPRLFDDATLDAVWEAYERESRRAESSSRASRPDRMIRIRADI